MSVKIMAQVWEGADDVRQGERLVLLKLADNCNDNYQCWPSVATISKQTKLAERSVQYAIGSLVEKGYMTVVPQAGPYATNLYVLNEARLSQTAPGVQSTTTGVQSTAQGGANNNKKDVVDCTLTVIEPSEEPSIEPSKKKPVRATPFPDDFAITGEMQEWAKKNVPTLNIIAATDEWATAMQSNTTKYRYTNWVLAWYNGMRKADQWGKHQKPKELGVTDGRIRFGNGANTGPGKRTNIDSAGRYVLPYDATADEVREYNEWLRSGAKPQPVS